MRGLAHKYWEMLRISVKTILAKKGRWIAWSKPESELIKVNTDGSKRGGNTTGGGVLRDELGNFIFGFSTIFNHQDTLRAELEAILEGATICKQLGISNYTFETDSSLAYMMIRNPDKEQWQYTYILRRIRDTLDHSTQLTLICIRLHIFWQRRLTIRG